MSEPSDEPEWRTNLLRARMLAAADRAVEAPGNIRPAGGNLASAVLETLTDAWVSPGRARVVFAETVEGAAAQVTTAFYAQGAECRAAAAGEPHEVDLDGPQGWKASSGRIDARVRQAR